jgi:hypothetical protein
LREERTGFGYGGRMALKRFSLRGRSLKTGRFIPLKPVRRRRSTSIIERIPIPGRKRR